MCDSMNKKKLLFASFLLATSSLIAQEDNSAKTTFEITQGYRRDSLDIGFSSHRTNIHREKDRYKHAKVHVTRLGMAVEKNDFFLKGIVSYGNVHGGKYHAIAHSRTHFNGATFHQNSKITGDYTADFALNFGKNFHWANGFSIAPTLGYGIYWQKFHNSHGRIDAVLKRRSGKWHMGRGKKRTYKATWYSPQIGFIARQPLSKSLSAFASYSFLFPLNYHADQHNSSHRHRKGKFEQENKAYKSYGHLASLGLDWNFIQGWSLKPEVELMKFYSKGGDAGHRYRFDKATRTATEYRLVLSYSF
jgi:hypothetical protein